MGEKERERHQRENVSAGSFLRSLQWIPVALSGSPTVVAGAQILDPSCTALPVALPVSWIGSGAARTLTSHVGC